MNHRSTFPHDLILVYVLLVGLGLIQIFSSSSLFAEESFGSSFWFFRRQVLFCLFLPFVFWLIWRLDPIWLKRWGHFSWPLGIGALALTLFAPMASSAGGASRWIALPWGLRVEPSEFLKVAFCFLVAFLATKPMRHSWALVTRGLAVAFPMIILLQQPDFGSTVTLGMLSLVFLFVYGSSMKILFGLSLAGFISVASLIVYSPYRFERWLTFLDPWRDPQGHGFQIIQSMLGFNSGGFFGVGLGKGQAKLHFLPEAHTDFTLTILAEEMGFVGFVTVLVLYAYIFWRGFWISIRMRDRYFEALGLSLTMLFGLSVLLNAGVVTGMLPTKGLPLPFLSYGGSSLLANSLIVAFIAYLHRLPRRP